MTWQILAGSIAIFAGTVIIPAGTDRRRLAWTIPGVVLAVIGGIIVGAARP